MWVQRGIQPVRHERCTTVNTCVADELGPGGRRSSVLSGTSVRAAAEPPCALSQVWRSAFAANLRHSSSLQRRPQAPRWRRETESGRRNGGPWDEGGPPWMFCLLLPVV